MVDKFVIRLMDDENRLLGWTELQCESRPQGERRSCPFWPLGVTRFEVEQLGKASQLSVHWCDLDLVRVKSLSPIWVETGQVFDFIWLEPVWLVPAMDKQIVLPAVTVKTSVMIKPPTGSLVGASTV